MRSGIGKIIWRLAALVKSCGEFIGGIGTIAGTLYGLSWLVGEALAHVHIHVDHHWWAYRVWHASWWLIVPLLMVGIGWPFRRRALGAGLWAVGALLLELLGCAAGIGLFLGLLFYVSRYVGFLWGSVASCTALLVVAVGFVAVGRLLDETRGSSTK